MRPCEDWLVVTRAYSSAPRSKKATTFSQKQHLDQLRRILTTSHTISWGPSRQLALCMGGAAAYPPSCPRVVRSGMCLAPHNATQQRNPATRTRVTRDEKCQMLPKRDNGARPNWTSRKEWAGIIQLQRRTAAAYRTTPTGRRLPLEAPAGGARPWVTVLASWRPGGSANAPEGGRRAPSPRTGKRRARQEAGPVNNRK